MRKTKRTVSSIPRNYVPRPCGREVAQRLSLPRDRSHLGGRGETRTWPGQWSEDGRGAGERDRAAAQGAGGSEAGARSVKHSAAYFAKQSQQGARSLSTGARCLRSACCAGCGTCQNFGRLWDRVLEWRSGTRRLRAGYLRVTPGTVPCETPVLYLLNVLSHLDRSLRAGQTRKAASERAMNQRPTNYLEGWDGVADGYAEMTKRIDYFAVNWMRRHVEELQNVSECRVMDLGCGPGLNIVVLKERHSGIRADGIDISPQMIKSAQATGCY